MLAQQLESNRKLTELVDKVQAVFEQSERQED